MRIGVRHHQPEIVRAAGQLARRIFASGGENTAQRRIRAVSYSITTRPRDPRVVLTGLRNKGKERVGSIGDVFFVMSFLPRFLVLDGWGSSLISHLPLS